MKTNKHIAIVGSRAFQNYEQLKKEVLNVYRYGDEFVSGGAIGADSMGQRLAKELGITITVVYPNWTPNGVYDHGAGFKRNKIIVEKSDIVLAFYAQGKFQQGGTSNTIHWARELDVPYLEFEEY